LWHASAFPTITIDPSAAHRTNVVRDRIIDASPLGAR
jgi:hypothetical protein